MLTKKYIGDGAYVEVRHDSLVLTTSNGLVDTNTIYVSIDDLPALEAYIAKFKELFV